MLNIVKGLTVVYEASMKINLSACLYCQKPDCASANLYANFLFILFMMGYKKKYVWKTQDTL